MGNLLAKEALTPRLLVAALVIVSAVALINTARSKPVKPAGRMAVVPAPGED
jgi:drug/metabolite transporter (DMT)-like permease